MTRCFDAGHKYETITSDHRRDMRHASQEWTADIAGSRRSWHPTTIVGVASPVAAATSLYGYMVRSSNHLARSTHATHHAETSSWTSTYSRVDVPNLITGHELSCAASCTKLSPTQADSVCVADADGGHTIRMFELIIACFRDLYIIDECAVGRLEIDDIGAA